MQAATDGNIPLGVVETLRRLHVGARKFLHLVTFNEAVRLLQCLCAIQALGAHVLWQSKTGIQVVCNSRVLHISKEPPASVSKSPRVSRSNAALAFVSSSVVSTTQPTLSSSAETCAWQTELVDFLDAGVGVPLLQHAVRIV